MRYFTITWQFQRTRFKQLSVCGPERKAHATHSATACDPQEKHTRYNLKRRWYIRNRKRFATLVRVRRSYSIVCDSTVSHTWANRKPCPMQRRSHAYIFWETCLMMLYMVHGSQINLVCGDKDITHIVYNGPCGLGNISQTVKGQTPFVFHEQLDAFHSSWTCVIDRKSHT
jgi:hypothetical protein